MARCTTPSATARRGWQLNVENIFDKKYYPTVDGNNNISPGSPRAVRLTLLTSF